MQIPIQKIEGIRIAQTENREAAAGCTVFGFPAAHEIGGNG